jgi:hypothetical protein
VAVDALGADRARIARPALPRTVAATALAVALATVTWMALAAAARPSVLSPPSLRTHAPWLLGPLSGLLHPAPAAPATLQDHLTIGLAVLLGAWALAWSTAGALPLRAVATVVGAAQAVLVAGPPQPLTDTFNYVVYGRMALRGINPYTNLPVDGPHGTVYALSNWHHFPSPYGPLFTLVSMPLGLLPAAAALWVWKAVVLACALGVLALVAALARHLGRSPQRAVAAVGLCPVTLVYGVGGLHNDGPSMVCLLAAALLVVRPPGRHDGRLGAAAGALAVAAAGLKPSFAVVVPLVVVGARDRAAAIAGAAAAGAATLVLVSAVFGAALPAIGLQGRLVTPLSVPNLAGVVAGQGGADGAVRTVAQHVLIAVVALVTALVAWRRRFALPAIGVVLGAALLTVSWVMPWYLAWSLPFAALAPWRRAVVPLVALLCAWLVLGAGPLLPSVLHTFGYYPTRTTTGLQNHDLETELVR